ncbi:hypothetical protein QBC46DRAFT_315499 [Diplogelasinospora grovesii]|uniref:Uncharacterized protein n=1 Tax=Diplogelasinospora grovesii TaxID=303347 RepID=A0AAN6N9B3_9PEZI|nr:hypothetical protein QBC46DRAFT_315499 [Diplogelasinospora grovesii]
MRSLIPAAVLLLAGLSTAQSVTCPTITRNIHCSTCAVAMCIPLSTLSVPCGCQASPVPSTVISHPCSLGCAGGGCVSTAYATVAESPCKTTSISAPSTLSTTTTPSISTTTGCPTITTTARPAGCTPTNAAGSDFCAEPACIVLTTVTVPCSCVSELPVKTKTITACTCRTTCMTTTQLGYIPCPTSVSSPLP